jgi:spore coat polysaccharide biosynthesis predicted glycosyltransferase SpsG
MMRDKDTVKDTDAKSRIVFLCAGGKKLGAGHIKRCAKIAGALVKKGVRKKEIFFLAMSMKDDELSPAVLSLIKGSKGFGYKAASDNIIEVKRELDMLSPNVVFCDALDFNTQALSPRSYRIIAMSNYLPGADIYINILKKGLKNRFIGKGKEATGGACGRNLPHKEFSGYKYWPIAKPASEKIKSWKDIDDKVRRILISCGYTDPAGMTKKILGLVTKFYEREKQVGQDCQVPQIVCIIRSAFAGGKEKGKKGLENDLKMINPDSVIKKDLKSIDNELLKSDLCITAGGNTLMESIAKAVPAFAVPVDDLNHELCSQLERKGFVIKTKVQASSEPEFHKLFKKISLRKTRLALSKKCRHFDGFGMQRITDIILSCLKN